MNIALTLLLGFIAGIAVVLIPCALAVIYLIKTQTADDPNGLVIDGEYKDGNL